MAPDNPNPPDGWAWWVSPPRAFVCIALLIGLPLALITAPFQAPDEPQHILRIYQISEGGLLPMRHAGHGGGNLPLSLVELPRQFADIRFHPKRKTSWNQIRAALQVPLEPNRRQFIPFVTAIYPPVGYMPQATAMAIGREIGQTPLELMYLARIANLLAWIAMGYVGLRVTPVGHRAILMLLLMPMSIFQAASLSADATINGLAVVFAAVVVRFALGPSASPISALHWAGLTLLSAVLTLSKFAYLPLAALVLLIPLARFGDQRRAFIAISGFFAVNLLAIALWAPQTHGLDANLRDRTDVSAAGQIRYLETHPSAIISVPARTLMIDGWQTVRSFVGWLGSMDARMSAIFVIVYLSALILACWAQRPDIHSLRIGKWMIVILGPVALCLVAIGLLNYLYWTPIGTSHIEGLQGRYLIPLAPAIVCFLWAIGQKLPPPPWNSMSRFQLDAISAGIALFGGGYAIILVYLRYYVR